MTTPPCKICRAPTQIQGCVDSGRSCEINRGIYLPLTGTPITYHRCTQCRFLFTTAFDAFSIADFQAQIYNEGYAAADPDYADGSRARTNAALVASILTQLAARSTLDYGGGDGTLAATLRAQSIDAYSWDPVADASHPLPVRTFDLVTAFEVFEHAPTPIETAAQALSCVAPTGGLLFSTLLLDTLPPQSTDHWYIAPRNGHISIHTTASLQHLFAGLGWACRSFNANLHIAHR